jgi:hypothetical protein
MDCIGEVRHSSDETNGCPRREHRGRYDEPKEWIA